MVAWLPLGCRRRAAIGQKRPLNDLYQNSGIHSLTDLGLGFLRSFGTVRIADMID